MEWTASSDGAVGIWGADGVRLFLLFCNSHSDGGGNYYITQLIQARSPLLLPTQILFCAQDNLTIHLKNFFQVALSLQLTIKQWCSLTISFNFFFWWVLIVQLRNVCWRDIKLYSNIHLNSLSQAQTTIHSSSGLFPFSCKCKPKQPTPLTCLNGHQCQISYVQFSSYGRWAASTSFDESIKGRMGKFLGYS